MAVTPNRIYGFETGQLNSWGWNISSTSISTSTVRTGLRSMQMNPTAATGQARHLNTWGAGQTQIIAAAFYVRFAAFPDADWTIFTPTSAQAGSFRWNFSTSLFCISQNGVENDITSVTPALDTWYRVVLEFDSSTTTNRARCVIDNDTANELNVSFSSSVVDITEFIFGQAAATRTLDMFVDDLVVSITDGDYEQMRDDWTDHAIESLIPSSDGTHNITTSGDFDSFTGTAFSNSTTNGYTFIGHRPCQFANTADQVIRQELGTTSNYMEFGLENHTLSGTPVGGQASGVHVESATSGASLGELRLLLADNTEVLVADPATPGTGVSVINSTNDPGTTVTARRRTTPVAGDVTWDNTKVDGLKIRVGFADNAPDVNFIDFMLEMLYFTAPAAAPGPPIEALTRRPQQFAASQLW